MTVKAVHRTIEREVRRGKIIMERNNLVSCFFRDICADIRKAVSTNVSGMFIASAQSGGTAPPARCGTSSTRCRRGIFCRHYPVLGIGPRR